MKKLLAALFLIILLLPAQAGVFGPLFSGSSQVAPPTGTAPVVTSMACTIALPVTNGVNVNLVGGGTCAYSATCASAACTGQNAITAWNITAQSTANSYSITNAGILQGGSAAGSVTTGSYTVTVTATNSTGASPGVVQSISVFQPPVVASLACSIKSPITNNTNVVLQAGGSCQYTATCGGGACSGANAISGWSVVADTCSGCYQVTSSGVLQGSTNAGAVTNTTSTVSVVATNAGGNSPSVGQTVTAVTVPHITNQNFNVAFPVTAGTLGTMAASPAPTTWAITAVSAGGTGATTSDFAITSPAGVLSTTSSAPTDITTPGTAVVSLTATNATGTSPTGTATSIIGSSSCAQGTSYPDGCPSAPPGTPQFSTSILSGYVTRPPWNVPGVDYHIGINRSTYPTNGSLKDPRVGGNLPSGATYSTGVVTVASNNVTLDGFDFSLGGTGNSVSINAGVSGTIISNSNFVSRSNSTQQMITVHGAGNPGTGPWASNVTVINCEMDGGGTQGFGSQSTNAPIFWQGNGTLTVEYTYIFNFAHHGIDFQTNNNTTTPIIKYSVFSSYGFNGGHPNAWYFEANGSGLSNNFTNGHFDFDLLYQPSSPTTTGGDSALSIFASEASYVTISNTTANYGVVISKTSAFGEVFSGGSLPGNSSNIQISNNYYDPTNIGTIWATFAGGSYNTFSGVGNRDMTTGLNAPQWPGSPYSADGSTSAPAGIPQLATLLIGEASRPPFNVPGVDYADGPPLGQVFKVPGVNSPPGCAVFGGSTMTVTASNCTLDGWDFTPNILVNIQGSLSNVTVTNSKFSCTTPSAQAGIKIGGGTTGTVITKNSFMMGGSTNSCNSLGDAIFDGGSSTMTVQYNYLYNTYGHIIDFTGSSGSPNVQFNVLYDPGSGSGSHGNPWYFDANSGTISAGTFNFNTVLYDVLSVGTNPALALPAGEVGVLVGTTTLSFNTALSLGGTGMNNIFNNGVINSAGGNSYANNYYDPTNATVGTWQGSAANYTSLNANNQTNMHTGAAGCSPGTPGFC